MNVGKQASTPPRLGAAAFLAMLLGCIAHAQTSLGQSTPADAPADMDQAIALLNEARLHFQDVRDYECRLIKRERVNGELLPDGMMTMKARNNPLSIYLRCESPKD